MNVNHLIQRVSSLISNEIDGDLVHLIDSHLPDALATACKLISVNKPVGHEKIMLPHGLSPLVTLNEDGLTSLPYPYVTIDSTLIVKSKFHRVNMDLTTEFEEVPLTHNTYNRLYMVGDYQTLAIADLHQVPYYFVDANRLYFKIPAAVLSGQTLNSIIVYDHSYLTIDQYPDQLADILIAELVRLIRSEQAKQK